MISSSTCLGQKIVHRFWSVIRASSTFIDLHKKDRGAINGGCNGDVTGCCGAAVGTYGVAQLEPLTLQKDEMTMYHGIYQRMMKMGINIT